MTSTARFKAALATALAALAMLGAAPGYIVGPNSQRDGLDGLRFIAALRNFLGELGERPGGYVVPDWPIWEQVSEGMTGGPDPILFYDDGTRILSACRHHSCMEKAVIVSEADEILAAGLVNYHCRFIGDAADMRKPPRRRKSTCDDGPTLTLFLRPGGAHRDVLEAWARNAVDAPLSTEVVWVPKERKARKR